MRSSAAGTDTAGVGSIRAERLDADPNPPGRPRSSVPALRPMPRPEGLGSRAEPLRALSDATSPFAVNGTSPHHAPRGRPGRCVDCGARDRPLSKSQKLCAACGVARQDAQTRAARQAPAAPVVSAGETRSHQVARLFAAGLTRREIAEHFGIRADTAKKLLADFRRGRAAT
jgi:hypothetical protein